MTRPRPTSSASEPARRRARAEASPSVSAPGYGLHPGDPRAGPRLRGRYQRVANSCQASSAPERMARHFVEGLGGRRRRRPRGGPGWTARRLARPRERRGGSGPRDRARRLQRQSSRLPRSRSARRARGRASPDPGGRRRGSRRVGLAGRRSAPERRQPSAHRGLPRARRGLGRRPGSRSGRRAHGLRRWNPRRQLRLSARLPGRSRGVAPRSRRTRRGRAPETRAMCVEPRAPARVSGRPAGAGRVS